MSYDYLARRSGRYPIGAFYFNQNLWNEESVRQLSEMGVDFLLAVTPNEELFALCEKYRIGILESVFPSWWGGDGDNAGGYAKAVPEGTLVARQAQRSKSSANWGDYLVDEPNAKDFAHIDKICKEYSRIWPDDLPFINLYPNYASIPKNTADETVSQLGTATYYEHIERYVREIDLPYICFDYYPFTGVFDHYLENLDITAAACRRTGKELWVIIQTGAWKAEKQIFEYQLRWQAMLCLAYGARSIMHASYCKGWWDVTTACVDADGKKNPMYTWAEQIDRELHAMGDAFLQYVPTGVCVRGDIDSADARIRPQLIRQSAQRDSACPDPWCGIDADGAIVVGCFRREAGEGRALMLVNAKNPFDPQAAVEVILTPETKKIILHRGETVETVDVADGTYKLTLASGEGVFAELIG